MVAEFRLENESFQEWFLVRLSKSSSILPKYEKDLNKQRCLLYASG